MLSVKPETESDISRAQQLAKDLNLPLFQNSEDSPVVLMVGRQGSWLRRLAEPVLDWHIDFTSSEYTHNFAGRTRHNDPLSRAVGLHKDPQLRILDLTGGLGKDALWLHHCGAKVTVIERHPALAYLLSQAAEQAQISLQVICDEAQSVLAAIHPDQFDVAYYDPMFERRTKSALVKKDMQILQAMHGEGSPDQNLIVLALQTIPKVVVKRAKSDPVLMPGVHHELTSKVTRFDVYQK